MALKKKPEQSKPPKVMPSQKLEAIGIESICAYVAGGKSLLSWCNANGFAYNTVSDWIGDDVERVAKYARAREDRADAAFESLTEVSEAAAMADSAVQVAGLRLKADNIKWQLARMSPRKYGDKIAIGGADDLPAIKQDVTLTPEEAYKRLLG